MIWRYATAELVAAGVEVVRVPLTLEACRGDRSLGLRPVGRLAFTGFWMLLGSVGPLVLTASSDRPGVVVGIGVLVAGVGLFFSTRPPSPAS